MQKIRIWIMAVPFLAILTLTVLTARAGAKESVSLSADGSQAEVTLEVPAEMVEQAEGVVSLQLSFQIEAGTGTLSEQNVSFSFGDDIGSAVKEQRYDPKTGTLSIYISGSQDLYEKERLSLGRIEIRPGGEESVAANVRVVPDSLRTINRAHGIRESGVNAPDSVNLVAGGASEPGEENPPEPPIDPEKPGSGEGEGPVQPGAVVGNQKGELVLGSKNPENSGISQGIEKIGNVLGFWKPAGSSTLEGGKKIPGLEHLNQSESGSPEPVQAQEAQEGETAQSASAQTDEKEKKGRLFDSWLKSLRSMDADAWIRIFLGILVAAALVMVGISVALLAGSPKKRRRKRKRERTGARMAARDRTARQRKEGVRGRRQKAERRGAPASKGRRAPEAQAPVAWKQTGRTSGKQKRRRKRKKKCA